MSEIPTPGVTELLQWMLRRRVRYRVDGDSMRPTLSSEDFVLVDPNAFVARPPRVNEVVVARHPYQPTVIIKRVAKCVEGGVTLEGDNPEASSDSRSFGTVSLDAIIGRVTSRIT